MPKYLFKANYTADGIKGVAKEGGTARAKAAASLATAEPAMACAMGMAAPPQPIMPKRSRLFSGIALLGHFHRV